MDIDYIIVQAGGRGTRLEHLTANKPKALVPVENLPILFHLFRSFPDKRFIIIADYKKEVLREYLACFADVRYQVVDTGESGTCAGLIEALRRVPDGAPLMLVWSDLIVPAGFALPQEPGNYVGISVTFPCRWSCCGGVFQEVRSEEQGVAGLFLFRDKATLVDVPPRGEFVRWLQGQGLDFMEWKLEGVREFGTLCEYEKLATEKCRPFNRITVEGGVLTKEGIDEQGRKLAKLERRWYELAKARGVSMIPEIYGLEPLRMEYIRGKNIYEYTGLAHGEKQAILRKLTDALKSLHAVETTAADSFSLGEAYYTKTMQRLGKIRDLVPFADREVITVNGRPCRNVFFHKRELERKLESLRCDRFAFIHGDCTFSNMMLRGDTEPVLIDPRGYFGFTELYGDPLYDWAKLYYSIVGNYDRFNLKDFRLAIGTDGVELSIASNGWEDMESEFFALSGADTASVRLLHAVIWLSFTTYAWQDYDSICGAFYNGIYYLEEAL